MRLAGRKRFTLLEWIVLFGLTGLALGLAEYSGLDGKWGDAIVYTVVVFGAVILVLRPAWGRTSLWTGVPALLFLHTIVLLFGLQLLPAGLRRLPWIILTGIGMLEALLLASILWKRATSENKR